MKSPSKSEGRRRPIPPERRGRTSGKLARASRRLLPSDLRAIFRDCPISIWVEDFSGVKIRLDELKNRGIRDLRAYLRKHPEEVITLAHRVKILAVNDATLRLYEARTKGMLLRGLGLVFDKESYDVFREEVIALAEGRADFSSEAVTKSIQGSLRRVLLKMIVPPGFAQSLSCVFVFLVDITELAESQEELRASEARYRTLVESAPDALVIFDASTGLALEANRRAERLFGLPRDQIIGMHRAQLMPNKGPAPHHGDPSELGGDGIWFSSEVALATAGGENVTMSVRTCRIRIQERPCVWMIVRESDNGQREIKGPGAIRGIGGHPGGRADPARLSRRERDVIALIAAGRTSRQISKTLFISIKTVETHRARIMSKFGFHKTADIVRFAILSGLCDEVPPKS